MKDKILIIIPTRERNDKHKEVYDSVTQTSKYVDVLFGLDEDDAHNYERIYTSRAKYEVNPRIRMLPTLNLLANKYADKYEYIGFMGDDHRSRTRGWDTRMMQTIGSLGIAYGDDLNQGEKMCTAVVMSSDIIKALGYMSPPELIHLYADIFWKELGEATGILSYIPSIIMEHMHYTVGKSQPDALYADVNSGEMFSKDGQAYARYKDSGEFAEAVEKVLKIKRDTRKLV